MIIMATTNWKKLSECVSLTLTFSKLPPFCIHDLDSEGHQLTVVCIGKGRQHCFLRR